MNIKFTRINAAVTLSALASGTWLRGDGLILVLTFHFVAGVLTGSLFAARTLLNMVALIFIECVGVTIALGPSIALWLVGSLIAIEVGYLGGIYIRSVLERAGIAEPSVRSQHRY